MSIVERGTVREGGIVLDRALCLPDGTSVEVRIDALEAGHPESGDVTPDDFVRMPAFGMWSDREDMADSTAWVRQERERWHQRQSRQD